MTPPAAEAVLPSQPGPTMNTPSNLPAATVPWEELAAQVEGKLSVFRDASDSAANNGLSELMEGMWNALLHTPTPVFRPARPAACLTAHSKGDVVKGVAFAMQHGLRVSAKGTGHHYGGASLVDGGLILDLGQLRTLSIDPVARTARVGPGVVTRQLREASIPHGLHFPGGHISSVGVAGFTLGGGHGWGVTRWGAAADNVLSYEVVLPASSPAGADVSTAAGGAVAPQVVQVSEASDPQLFAGLRGAGPYLGIVTEFTVALHPVPPSLPVISAIYPVDLAPQVAEAYHVMSRIAPNSVEASLALFHLPVTSSAADNGHETDTNGSTPSHQPVICLSAVGFDHSEAPGLQQAYDVVRQLLPEQRVCCSDDVQPYLTALASLDGAWEAPGLCLYGHGMFVEKESITADLMKAVASQARAMTSPRSLILFAPASPAPGSHSAFDFRGGVFLSAYAMWCRTPAGPEGDGDARHVAWVDHVRTAVGRAAVGLYGNEVMMDRPGQARACFKPGTLTWLAQVKARTDPHGLLRPLAQE